MGKHRKYSEETKAAVLAALLEGQAVSQVAREYDIPRGTVKSWKNRLKNEGVAKVATQKKKRSATFLPTTWSKTSGH